MTHADVVIIGAGVTGSSVAWNLLVRDPTLTVLLLDAAPSPAGATAQSAGLLRVHHTLHSDTQLAAASLPTFHRWSEIVGGDCGYRRAGFLIMVRAAQQTALRANISAARSLGVDVHEFDVEDLRTRFPDLAISNDDLAAFEPDGGFGSPTAAALAWQADFRRRGGRHLTGVEVHELGPVCGERQTLYTNLGLIAASEVVVANGTGARRLLAGRETASHLMARRIGLARIEVPGSVAARLPACIDDVTGTYFRPTPATGIAVGVPTKPPSDERTDGSCLTEAEIAQARRRALSRVPIIAAGAPYGGQVASDTYTPDGRPLLGRSTATGERVTLAVGFSGGGFKISPAVGNGLARRILDGGDVQDLLTPYAPDRFAAGRPLTPEAPYAHM